MKRALHWKRSWRPGPSFSRGRLAYAGLGLLGSLLLAAGCGPAIQPVNCDFGPAQQVVTAGIEAMGGLERWQSVERLQAKAIVTVYDEQGTAVVHEQQQEIFPRTGELLATAALAGGNYRIRVTSSGRGEFQGPVGLVGGELKGRLVSAMQMTLHRVRGPYNLCLGERAGQPGPAQIQGSSLIRVSVAGGRADIRAYYFNAESCLLSYATAGGDKAGQAGTVSQYTWGMLGNGMAFPTRLRVFRIGQDVLVGEQLVLDVEYHNVRIR